MTDAARTDAERLLREVMSWHADPKSPDYNECDTAPCRWCEQAAAALRADQPVPPSSLNFQSPP